MKLTKDDPDAGGEHHFIPLAWVDHVDSTVHLKQSGAEAKGRWKELTEGHAGHPGAVAARRMLAEALARSGQWPEAASVWSDLSGPLTEQEKLANLFQARRAAKKE